MGITFVLLSSCFVIWICSVLWNYGRILAFHRRVPNVGFPFPLIGNMDKAFGSKEEDLFQLFVQFSQCDPERRKFAAAVGGERMLLLYHPETVEPILTSNVNITKSFFYDFMLKWLGTGLLMSSDSKWKQRRKLLTPAFHFKILEDAMSVFNENGDALTSILLEDGSAGQKPLDLFPYICRCTLDIILESAMGERLKIQHQRESEYASQINDMVHLIVDRTLSPWIHPDVLFNLSPSGKKQNKLLKSLHGFTQEVIQKRKSLMGHAGAEEMVQKQVSSKKNKRMAFLDLLLTVRTSDGECLSDADIQEEVDTFMFEGHDTTACALAWTLLLVANHPEVQERIHAEQLSIYEDNLEMDVTQEHLSQMKYLESVIKEALRLYPSVPIFGRKLDEDIEIDGVTIEKGVAVSVVPFLLHRNPKIWDNPEEFRPERFLESTNRSPFAYVPFSAGPRNCIGQRFALMVEKTVLSKLFRKVKLNRVTRVAEVKPRIEVVTRPHCPIFAKFEPRAA